MRALFNDHYKRGKGFTTEDMIAIVNRLTKKDYHDFFNKYVWGTDVPDYDKIFGYAGYKLEKKTTKAAVFGMGARNRNGGAEIQGIEPGSPAELAGLKVGDIIQKINGDDFRRAATNELAGKATKFTVDRGGKEMEFTMNVGSRDVTGYSLVDAASMTDQQKKIREGWLKR
jgi:predicted metalloprotease with PDZ domain